MTISNANQTLAAVNRWKYTSTGGETSLSGLDDNGNTLSYQLGTEQLHLNGLLLVRGVDYVATTGSSITGLIALIAGDVIDIVSTVSTVISGMVPLSTVTTQGDLIVATGAGAVTRLGVGTSGQYLQTTGTGVQWASVSGGAGNMTLIASSSVSGSTISLTGLSSYDNLFLIVEGLYWGTNAAAYLKYTFNADSSAKYTYGGYVINTSVPNSSIIDVIGGTSILNSQQQGYNLPYFSAIKLNNCKSTGFTDFDSIIYYAATGGSSYYSESKKGVYTASSAINSIQVINSNGYSFSYGTYTLWGA